MLVRSKTSATKKAMLAAGSIAACEHKPFHVAVDMPEFAKYTHNPSCADLSHTRMRFRPSQNHPTTRRPASRIISPMTRDATQDRATGKNRIAHQPGFHTMLLHQIGTYVGHNTRRPLARRAGTHNQHVKIRFTRRRFPKRTRVVKGSLPIALRHITMRISTYESCHQKLHPNLLALIAVHYMQPMQVSHSPPCSELWQSPYTTSVFKTSNPQDPRTLAIYGC